MNSAGTNTDIVKSGDATFPVTHLFEYVSRTTIAERFPVLTCFVIALGMLATAVITEIECLKGSGYFW